MLIAPLSLYVIYFGPMTDANERTHEHDRLQYLRYELEKTSAVSKSLSNDMGFDVVSHRAVTSSSPAHSRLGS